MTTTSSAAPRLYRPANGLGVLLDFAANSHLRAAVLLVAVSLLAFLPGFFQIPPVDRDEAYFAQATKQMIETGDYVDIRYQDDVRYRKPVGIYWLQAAVVKTAEALKLRAARTTIWLYRVPSLLGAIGAVLATYWCALAFVGRRGAVLGCLDDGGLRVAQRRGPPCQDRCRAAVHGRHRHGRAGARLSAAAQAGRGTSTPAPRG